MFDKSLKWRDSLNEKKLVRLSFLYRIGIKQIQWKSRLSTTLKISFLKD